MKAWLAEAYKEAQLGLAEGGLPIGMCQSKKPICVLDTLRTIGVC